MYTLLSLHITPSDTPTAATARGSTKVVIDPAGSRTAPGALHFESTADARRWLEDALDAITDAERAAARDRVAEEQERIAEAHHDQSEDRDPRESADEWMGRVAS